MRRIIEAGAGHFRLRLTEAQLDAFGRYAEILIEWNRRLNLTRIIEPDEIAVKHFLDSLSIYPALPPDTGRIIDVGSGAGFPGLPLKIALPHLRLTLLEATGKKTAFLRHAVETLGLAEVEILTARAEEAGHLAEHREQYDVALARAVAALPVLAEYTLPLVRVGGLVVAQKGQQPAAEIETARPALRILGGEIRRVLPVDLPGLTDARHLVLIAKKQATPSRYPRRPGLPAKRPLA